MEVEREIQRMDAGVGTGAALHVGAGAGHGLQRVLEGRADGGGVGLDLKPAVAGALVGETKQQIHGS